VQPFPSTSPLKPDDRFVAIVDDDEAVCDSLDMLLRAAGYATRTYGSAESLLRELLPTCACAIVDLRLRGMTGLQLQSELAQLAYAPPVIVITAHGDVASARSALLAGAIDFLEKPIDNDELLLAVSGAVLTRERQQQTRLAEARAQSLLATLSAREREVFDRLVDGMHNREIALDLGISPRTVEVYRAHVMTKLQARRLADLLRMRPAADPQRSSDGQGPT
jgi:two-component system response regulator FixJ